MFNKFFFFKNVFDFILLQYNHLLFFIAFWVVTGYCWDLSVLSLMVALTLSMYLFDYMNLVFLKKNKNSNEL